MGYANAPLGPSSVAAIDSSDSDDSLFSFGIRARTNQMCAYDSRLQGEVEEARSIRSRQQRRPCGVGCKAWRRHPQYIAAGDIDGVERRPGVAAGMAEEHQDAAVGREGRPLVVEAFGKDAFTLPVNPHDADREAALALLGERDEIAAR